MANLNEITEEESSSGTTQTTQSNTEKLEKYINDKCNEYQDDRFYDESLWLRLQEDFEKWTDEEIATVRRSSLNRLRDIVRLRGVWVAPSRDVRHDIIQVIRQEDRVVWTDEEIFEYATTAEDIKSPYLRRRLQLRDQGKLDARPTSPRPT